MKKLLNTLWTMILLCSYFVFSYNVFNGWWYSSIGTGLILVFSYLIWNKNAIEVVGLKLSLKTTLISIGLTVLIVIASTLVIKYIGSKHQIAFQFANFRNTFHDVFYVLNEEIILGGITLYILIKKLKIKPVLASLSLALIFSMIHFVFYKWIFIQSGIIELKTLMVLFMVGIVRNNLIIINKHIGYAWALHFGWMLVMFGCYHYRIETNIELTETERFNMFLGSSEMLIGSLILSVLSLLYMRRALK